MGLFKQFLNPWRVATFILLMILIIVAQFYLASFQTSKWHYICQVYYCPKWFKASTQLKKGKNDNLWRTWYKNSQLKSSWVINDQGDILSKSFYENGNLELLNLSRNDGKITSEEYWHKSGGIQWKKYRNNILGNERLTSYFKYGKKDIFREYKVLGCSSMFIKNVDMFRLMKCDAWHFNGKVKFKIKIKKGTVYFDYKFLNTKKHTYKKIAKENILEILSKYFRCNRFEFDEFSDSTRTVWDQNISSTHNYIQFLYINEMIGSENIWIEPQFKNNLLYLRIGFYNASFNNSDKAKYKPKKLKEIRDNHTDEILEIKMLISLEGENKPIEFKKYRYFFEYTYVDKQFVQYSKDDEVEFIQKYDKWGHVLKIDHYKKGTIEKTFSFVDQNEKKAE